jgi:hypothetical protein
MGYQRQQPSTRRVLELARAQHGVVSRAQLLALGFTAQAIKHRMARGRLHPLYRGVYAVGRPQVSRDGRWMAAVFRCGSGAALSHHSAAALWEICDQRASAIEVSLAADVGFPASLSIEEQSAWLT